MYSFLNDYSEGACTEIMQALLQTNMEQTVGYGMDQYCSQAKQNIKDTMNRQDVDVHFLVGGTQTNTTVISHILRPHQGVISASTGHINTHETGAIEARGHKVISIPSLDGRIYANEVDELMQSHYGDGSCEHTVQPGMVYISNPTEIGTIYTKRQLTALSLVCKKWNLPLFVDGARLGCALTSKYAEITLEDLVDLTDIFYIGGTKMGALFGEALVISNENLKKDFRYMIKQNGGMFAKGRLLGIQFGTLFTNRLYFFLANHANLMAYKLSDGIEKLGYKLITNTMSNQVFPVFPKEILQKLESDFLIGFWEKFNETSDVVRLCCSFATKEDEVDKFLKLLASYTK